MCLYNGCSEEKIFARSLCKPHYNIEWAGGNLEKYPKRTPKPIPPHGTEGRYTNQKCRCDLCREAHNKRAAEYSRKKREANWSEEFKAEQNRQVYSSKKLRKKYAIELESRNGICDICKRSFKNLVVDHDHLTQEIRGFLCHSCNTGLGKLGDNIDGLQRAIEYLKNGFMA